jgi:hypothetical protein
MIGVHQPLSISVVGSNTLNAVTMQNKECKTMGCNEKHLKWECPLHFFQTVGQTMPGFNASGNRDNACWSGNDINDECRRRWMAAKAAGHFSKNPYTKSKHAYPFAT